MSISEQLEILRGLVVLTAADGRITAGERGILEKLASRVGVGSASLQAMIERASGDISMRDDLFHRTMSNPEQVMELLVATARIDGEISEEERELLVHMMGKLNISTDRFSDVYQRGIARADTLRDQRL